MYVQIEKIDELLKGLDVQEDARRIYLALVEHGDLTTLLLSL